MTYRASGYRLRAVLARADLLRARVRELDLDHAVVATLRQGLGLIPVTPAFVEELTGRLPEFAGTDPGDTRPFTMLLSTPDAPGLAGVLAAWSRWSPVGYAEIAFHDLIGYQSAVIWAGGRVSWGPRFDDRFTGPRDDWPANAALARLGAKPGAYRDCFEAVGLGAERDTAGWLAYGRRGLTPDYYDILLEDWDPEP
jgi:hypothetical protein